LASGLWPLRRFAGLGISLFLPAGQRASIAIYGFDGRKIYEFAQPAKNKSTWDGTLADGARAPAGPFFVVVTITDGIKEMHIRKKGILWRK
jgi:hypothetical protein